MKLIVCIFLLLSLNIYSQNRNIRRGEDIISYGVNYHTVYIGSIDNYNNVEWKQWLLSDIILTKELVGVLPAWTQKEMSGIGVMVNGVSDSIFFTPDAALKVCPAGFRLPRIGEYDTLIGALSIEERKEFFNKLPGYITHVYKDTNDIIIKNKIIEKGGFWWTSTNIYNEEEKYKFIGIELDYMYNYHKGKGDLGDYAAVRCVRNKNDDE